MSGVSGAAPAKEETYHERIAREDREYHAAANEFFKKHPVFIRHKDLKVGAVYNKVDFNMSGYLSRFLLPIKAKSFTNMGRYQGKKEYKTDMGYGGGYSMYVFNDKEYYEADIINSLFIELKEPAAAAAAAAVSDAPGPLHISSRSRSRRAAKKTRGNRRYSRRN